MIRPAPGLALSLALLAGLAAAPAGAAEVVVIVGSGQTLDGDVPPGERIRIRFPLAEGAEPRLVLKLLGAARHQPVSFNKTELIGPGGETIDPGDDAFPPQLHRPGLDVLRFRNWQAPEAGEYQLLITTNAKITTRAAGRFKVKRARKTKFEGDESNRVVRVPLQPGDISELRVRRVSGTAPRVASYEPPSAPPNPFVRQTLTKKGSRTSPLLATQNGTHLYEIGYQGEPEVGAFKGDVRVKPFRGFGTARFQLTNEPGIPLSVREIDRFLDVDWGERGVGVDVFQSVEGTFVGVTSERTGATGNEIAAQRYTIDLGTVFPLLPPATVAASVDVQPGQAVSGHRLIWSGENHYVLFGTGSGQNLYLARLARDFQSRLNLVTLLEGSSDPTHDAFLVSDGETLGIGVYDPPSGHTVLRRSVADPTVSLGQVPIGGVSLPQARGVGAAWRGGEAKVFEVWAPDSFGFPAESAIHRQEYTQQWLSTSADAVAIDAPGPETSPTAVSIDPVTGVTVVHYVVPDAAAGTGRVHRRLFFEDGTEVPGSHAVLTGEARGAPSSVIVGAFLFLATDSESLGPTVERYRLLR